jgi:hypothetical protein
MRQLFNNKRNKITLTEFNAIKNNYKLCLFINNLTEKDYKVLSKLFNDIKKSELNKILQSLKNDKKKTIKNYNNKIINLEKYLKNKKLKTNTIMLPYFE